MTLNDPLGDLLASGKSPAEIVAAVTADAEVIHTPNGEGNLVWHRWGKGRPLVLVHGGSGSWTHWIKQVPGLKSRYEIFAVDLPGLGDSDMPPHPHIPSSLGTVLALGIKALIPREARAHVVAFSFGAHVSSHAMLHLQDYVADFTLTGAAALGLPQGPGKEYPREMEGMTDEERMEVHRGLLEILMFKEPSRIDPLAVHLQANNIRRARFRSRPFARVPEIAQNLPEIRVPVKAVWGGEDQTAWPSVEARYDVIRQSHPELITRTVPDAGHWVMYEQPAAYNQALVEVLEA
ncbi:MAG: alpha/beta hydrolase [Hyphomicrobiaceae bacterium]|nr:alpha/beta hydrolase [Hyphomicrobiaceae bacterium]